MKIKISRNQWEKIGSESGWLLKTALNPSYEANDPLIIKFIEKSKTNKEYAINCWKKLRNIAVLNNPSLSDKKINDLANLWFSDLINSFKDCA